ncbi:hypothetical protein MROS_1748 [Melioribacter roseus P3M-2]|uniref:Uncharacterized protein n=1 Tax=Melioribacter roseus (strain DSM 23840 / JCM 17771 / VKM B-2668 / P3M-2) TaxID=1191523 RepID=I6YWP5_MELRP|nr:hypothetical protein [Melioribacter roseus]AFN74982.1 hypothetical protein MROS_1748 [Melioribacter roseus P3M-2]
MNGKKIKILFLIASIFVLIILCTPEKEVEVSDGYTLVLKESKDSLKLVQYAAALDDSLLTEYEIKKSPQGVYLLTSGNYPSVFEAGKAGFELLAKSGFVNYRIYYKDKFVKDNYRTLLFIGNYHGRQSLYKYDLVKKKSIPYWSRWGRKALSLSYSEDRNYAFIITALSWGIRGEFPFVRDARLYHYRTQRDELNELLYFGRGLQIYSYWENEDTFKVNFTKPDTLDPQILIQSIYAFDKEGAYSNLYERRFDLTKDGFPKPSALKPISVSPNGKFHFRYIFENGESFIYLKNLEENKEVLIKEYEGELSHTQWSPDESYLFLTFKPKGNNRKPELIVINNNSMKIQRTFYGPYYMNLLVHGNLLFFDEENNGISGIGIYDYANDKIYDRINIPGGCGLKFML